MVRDSGSSCCLVGQGGHVGQTGAEAGEGVDGGEACEAGLRREVAVHDGGVAGLDARNALDLNVLVTIAASLGVGMALAKSGSAALAAKALVGIVGDQPYLILIVVYLFTLVATEFLSNAAAAAMMFPLAIAAAEAGGYSPRPFVFAIALSASLGFLTPIGYQTNLMVMGPGGYRPIDYVKVGWPLALITVCTALLVIPIAFPFALSAR